MYLLLGLDFYVVQLNVVLKAYLIIYIEHLLKSR